MFERAAVFTDIHFGKKSDSEVHNRDCLDFVEWFCREVIEQDCDAVIFMGDWFDNRSRLRVDTINYSWASIEVLQALKRPVYWLIGNHDIYFKNHRTMHSLPYLDGVNVVNEITEVGEALFVPWLVGSEFTEVPSYDTRYVFGHLELPLFLLNENVVMPDKGGLHMNHFENCQAVFSGHFHKRQLKVNEHGIPVWYIGNCFGHDFSDVEDKDRGYMLLEWGQDPQFIDWPEAPTYHRTTVSELLEAAESDSIEYGPRSTVECKDDLGLEIEEAIEIKDLIGSKVRDLRIRPKTDDLTIEQETEIGEDAQSVDDMVVEHLSRIDTEGSDYDAELLVTLYQSVSTD